MKKLTGEDEEGSTNRVACDEGKGQPLIILDGAEMSDTGRGLADSRHESDANSLEQTKNAVASGSSFFSLKCTSYS